MVEQGKYDSWRTMADPELPRCNVGSLLFTFKKSLITCENHTSLLSVEKKDSRPTVSGSNPPDLLRGRLLIIWGVSKSKISKSIDHRFTEKKVPLPQLHL